MNWFSGKAVSGGSLTQHSRKAKPVMDNAIFAVILSSAMSIIAAALSAGLTYHFTVRREREADWRKMKIELYRDYMSALSTLLNDISAISAAYTDATNALTLVAPPNVVEALYAFNDGLLKLPLGRHDEERQALLRALRRDAHPSLGAGTKDFDIRLVIFRPTT